MAQLLPLLAGADASISQGKRIRLVKDLNC
jgi:hypothetical protein